jgi:hypothetical protein
MINEHLLLLYVGILVVMKFKPIVPIQEQGHPQIDHEKHIYQALLKRHRIIMINNIKG